MKIYLKVKKDNAYRVDSLWRIVPMKKNRERSIGKLLYFTEQELEIIQNKMVESDMSNFSAYCREMLLTGKVKHYDFSVIKEISSSLSHISGNINQVALAEHIRTL